MKNFGYVMAALVLCLGSFPAITAAATTTDSFAYRINDTYSAYFIDFVIGGNARDLFLPTSAVRSTNQSSSSLSYALKTAEGLRTSEGASAALLMSSVPMVDGWYKVASNTAANFTLLVVHQKASSSSRTDTLLVTDLPFRLYNYETKATTTGRITPNQRKIMTVTASGTPARLESE